MRSRQILSQGWRIRSLDNDQVDSGVEISTDFFARQVTLAVPSASGVVFEDNYFDLAPGQKRTVRVIHPSNALEIEVSALNTPAVRVQR
jgi:hypothetical protein